VPGDRRHQAVPGAEDTFALYIDNSFSTGAIEFVEFVRVPGEPDPGDCALLQLPSNTTPIEVRYRVDDPEGFLKSYQLRVARGPGSAVGIAGSPISGAYSDVAPYRYQGTGGYVTVSVTPTIGWLPTGFEFCAFSFYLDSYDRLTNGRTLPDERRKATELVGMSVPPAPTP
jgi:hypothetical protein